MQLGKHKFREFDGVDAAFGANHSDYPKMGDIPLEHRSGESKGCEVFSSLFFSGGKLADHGLRLKDGVDQSKFYTTLRSLMTSFAPPHELKEATCGWLIQEYAEATS
jgi:hypothetical protein